MLSQYDSTSNVFVYAKLKTENIKAIRKYRFTILNKNDYSQSVFLG